MKNAFIGIESFVDKQLIFYKKGVKVSQNIEAINLLESLQIEYGIGILLFDPAITLVEIVETLAYLEKIASNHYLNVMTPFSPTCTAIPHQGTALYDYVEEHGLLNDSSILYRFENEDTQLCHDFLVKWIEQVSLLENGNEYFYRKLFRLEINIIKGLCEMIIAGVHDTESLAGYVRQELIKIEVLIKEVDDCCKTIS